MSHLLVNPYLLSIEPTGKKSYIHGYHLGTNEKIAREFAEYLFRARNNCNQFTTSVALMREGKIVDVYDGAWHSELVQS